ncbi:hypothetical protein Aca07nite_76940 [Actinoplanes capillaceus]|uniref:Uncharacterized protein n=1 Tax=Actinoplanes campanulatus TaxID=113559 RepID=A0ABQ3WVX3_9ACTN|nr:hypothetical protein [Actinoplanes capillaceus]GID50419.1 hypothetical protein Aca07nite_76940 [Actinoplanes capillaceus]
MNARSEHLLHVLPVVAGAGAGASGPAMAVCGSSPNPACHAYDPAGYDDSDM